MGTNNIALERVFFVLLRKNIIICVKIIYIVKKLKGNLEKFRN